MNYWTEQTYKQLVLRLDTLPQAVLIHGPRGLGKLELARSFAQRILCEGRNAGTQACGRCEGCRWFLAGQHPDYRQIEPEAIAPVVESDEEGDRPATAQKKKPSNEIRIEQVRELTDFLNIGSHRARRRIALFHPAEAINRNAANALLKSLEEPAPGAGFLLVSHQPRLLLPTIRSRCVAFAVHAPDVATGARWLEEQGIVSPAEWLALAAGAPLAAKDLATSDAGKRIAGWRALLEARPDDLAERLAISDREQLEPLVELLQKWAFDQAARDAGLPGKYGLAAGRNPRGAVQSAASGRWLRYAHRLARARIEARHPVNPKLFLVDLLAGMPE
jgi:DNA polymerase-3 subunit delta'